MGRRFAAGCLVVLALAGCGGGGSKSNGEAGKSAAQVVADAQAAAASAKTVHIVGAGTSNGTPLTLDLWLGKGRAQGHIEESGLGFDVVRIGDVVYVKGSDAFLKKFAGAGGATLLHGRWLKGSTTHGQLAALAPLTDIQGFFHSVLGQHGKIENRGEKTYKGQKTVEIRDTTQGGSLYIAAEGKPFPVAVVGGTQQGDVTLTDWDTPHAFTAPKDALDISKLP